MKIEITQLEGWRQGMSQAAEICEQQNPNHSAANIEARNEILKAVERLQHLASDSYDEKIKKRLGMRLPHNNLDACEFRTIPAFRAMPGPWKYLVSAPHGHKTLKDFDVVTMVEAPLPAFENLLLRESDWTLHQLQNEAGEYVNLVST